MSTHQTTPATADKLEGSAIMFDVLKGGVGKSALSLNLADRLAARGNDVLYMDLDPNGHISFQLGFKDVYNDETHDYGYVALDKKLYSKQTLDPETMVYETDYGFDFVPSYDDMEVFESTLKHVENKSTVLRDGFIAPLYERGAYDYFVFDGGGERSLIADNGFYAGKRAIVPLAPGDEALSAWDRTWNRIVKQLKDVGFEVLAVVPNLLTQRIDQYNDDRVLIERLNSSKLIQPKLPSFARYTQDELDAIDDGEDHTLPGIRRDRHISGGVGNGEPVSSYAPDCDQIAYFDELARIVETGGIE